MFHSDSHSLEAYKEGVGGGGGGGWRGGGEAKLNSSKYNVYLIPKVLDVPYF